jgi:UDP-glucose 4-epimerase/UDP-glucuronate decarboxylase
MGIDDTARAAGELRALAERSGGRLEIVELDLAAESAAARIPRGPFDVAFHLAAIVGVRAGNQRPYEAIAVNVRSTLALLDWAMTGAARAFLFASSSECYASGVDAGSVAIPTPEDVALSIGDITLPRWSYAASKIAGESAVFSAARERPSLVPLVVRFHNVYGPRMQPTHVVPEFLERCLHRVDPFPIYGAEQTRSFLHVQDAARAVRLVAATARADAGGGVFHIGSGEETKILDLAELVFSVSGLLPTLVHHASSPVSAATSPGGAEARGPRFPPAHRSARGPAGVLGSAAAATLSDGGRSLIRRIEGSTLRDRMRLWSVLRCASSSAWSPWRST